MPAKTFLNTESILALYDFARSDIDRQILAKFENEFATMSNPRCAADLGINLRTVTRRIADMRSRAAEAGVCSDVGCNGKNPAGFTTTKSTVQFDANGDVIQEWRRVAPGAREIQDLIQDLREEVKPVTLKKPPKRKATERWDELVIGDMHLGMFAWKKETGFDNYDIDIARKLLLGGAQMLFERSAGADGITIADVGDFIHCDNRHNKSDRSGHTFDVDGRWSKIIHSARMAFTELIELAATIYPKVHVIMVPGNHNDHAAVMLQNIIDARFHNCDRVTVDMSPQRDRLFTWGNCFWHYHHGDMISVKNAQSVASTKYRKEWGATEHHYGRCGHIHRNVKHSYADMDEEHGFQVEYFPVLPPVDAWHAASGYHSKRQIQLLTYDKQDGIIERRYETPERILRRVRK